MTEHLFCFCGYPITVEDVPTVEGERQVYTDPETGKVIEECPCCGDWPLDDRQLYAEAYDLSSQREPRRRLP